MLKSPSTTPTCEQLLLAFIASFRLFLVAFSFLALFALIFVRASVMFLGAWLALINAGCNWLIDLTASYSGTQHYCAFLATR
jgi:hypothetical protein